MRHLEDIGLRGLLIATITAEKPRKVKLKGDFVSRLDRNTFVLKHKNAFVNTGLNISLDRLFGLGTPPGAVSNIGVSSDATAVTAATTFLNGAAGGTAANTIIKAISPAATRTAQTVTAGASFANADFTSGVFAIHKVGLLNTATDAGTGLIDVIGGSGSAPYNKPFTIDLTTAGSFTLTMQIQVTAQAV